MSDNWTKDIKRLAENHIREVPEGLLDDVKSEMLRRGLMPTAQSEKVVPLHKWRYAAAAAVVAIIAGIGLTLFHHDSDITKTASTPLQKSVSTVQMPTTETAESGIVERLVAQVTRRAAVADTVCPQLSDAMTTQSADTATLIAKAETTHPISPRQPRHSADATNRYVTSPTSKRKKDSSWSVGAYYGGTTNANPTSALGALLAQSGDSELPEMAQDYAYNQMQVEEIATKDEKHRQSVKVGISLRYNLNSRWGLQTGITYTRLTSEFTEEKSTSSIATHQKLDYIGVPFTVNYNIWQNRHLIIYVAAGGAVEKLVNGAATTEKTVLNTTSTISSDDVSENRPVFSTSLAAGLEYMVNPYLNIYVQPGVTRHFDNGSGIKSIYTDKPLNMEFNLGVRIDLNK